MCYYALSLNNLNPMKLSLNLTLEREIVGRELEWPRARTSFLKNENLNPYRNST